MLTLILVIGAIFTKNKNDMTDYIPISLIIDFWIAVFIIMTNKMF